MLAATRGFLRTTKPGSPVRLGEISFSRGLENSKPPEHAGRYLNRPSRHLFWPNRINVPLVLQLALLWGVMLAALPKAWSQPTNSLPNLEPKRVLLIFSEARDLPGNILIEQAVRAEITAHSTNPIEFYTESLDASRFPNARHYREFEDYLKNKYAGQKLDLVMAFMAGDFTLADELPSSVVADVPVVFVAVSELEMPDTLKQRLLTGLVQRFDIGGTIKFILQLQPETRRIVVIGGSAKRDQPALDQISSAAESFDGVKFEFWTNVPISVVRAKAAMLPQDTVILLSTVQRDSSGAMFNTPQVARTLAPFASVPVYVLGSGLIGSGALGGSVVNLESLGTRAAQIGLQTLNGTPASQIPITTLTNGTPMVDWRTLERWNIKPNRLPANCVVHYRPLTLWEQHQILITFTGAVLLAQALTIAALLAQRHHRRQAEAEILRQRTELAHVARVSTMGQLASALTHELNQPLGAILRNAEAAEIFLQSDKPNLDEIRAILADIRRDDRRAGSVIDRMRTLYKRRNPVSAHLDVRELVEDTLALARHDAAAREVKLSVEIPARLPAARGDRVHLQQVLLNLVLNAMDAASTMPKSRRSVLVRAGETADGKLQLAVIDLGSGIAPDNAERIFEPFFTTKPDGMGMGLAISRTIIEAHGGDIWVETNALTGTKFTFTIPRAEAPAGLPAGS